MKNVELWTRDADRKILAGACALGVVVVASLMGAWIPTPGPVEDPHLLNGLIAAALLVFVWSAFRIVRPVRYSRKWIVAEFVSVPVVWGLLLVILALWFHHTNGVWEEMRNYWHDIENLWYGPVL